MIPSVDLPSVRSSLPLASRHFLSRAFIKSVAGHHDVISFVSASSNPALQDAYRDGVSCQGEEAACMLHDLGGLAGQW